MVKGTNNMIYEFVSEDTNEITKVATALHDALNGNRLYIHNKIVLHWAEGGFVMVDIPDVESCYNQLPKFLETYIEFNKFVKEALDGTREIKENDKLKKESNKLLDANVGALQSHCKNQRKEITLLLKQKDKLKKELEECKNKRADMLAYRDDIIREIYEEKNELENVNKCQTKYIKEMEANMAKSNEQYKKLKSKYDALKEHYHNKAHEMFDMLLTADWEKNRK